MRTKLTNTDPRATLERVIDLLASELISVSDEEILDAAKELGMDPLMKGSAAFIGLRHPQIADLADFFEPEVLKGLILARAQGLALSQSIPRAKTRRLKRPAVGEREDSADK
jgi:hypothetical protein